MYLLRDEDDYDFIKLIDNKNILTTRDLKEAIMFDDLEKAKALKNYIELEKKYYDLEIVEIEFVEIEFEEE